MNSLLSLLHCLLVALLYFDTTKATDAPRETRKKQVMKFMEVWDKSFCQPKEIKIDVLDEHPTEVEYIFRPTCVYVKRCGGCCSDEKLECIPTEISYVSMEVLRVRPFISQHASMLDFVQHDKCTCRSKGRRRELEKSHCEPCSAKRKHLYIQDPESCRCSCKFTHLRCKSKGLELNERSCRCEKPRR